MIIQSSAQNPPIMRASILKTVQFLARHLIFSSNANRDIDYHSIYCDGLLYGSYVNISMSKDAHPLNKVIIKEALHPCMLQAFRLDGSMLIELCQDLNIPQFDSSDLQSNLDDW